MLPFFIIINPMTIEIFKKIKKYFWTIFYSWMVNKKFSSFHSETYTEIVGAKYIINKGKVVFCKHNKIQCISKYGKEHFQPTFVIGANVIFADNCHIGCINRIYIVDNTLIGFNVLIIDHSHGYSLYRSGSPLYRNLYSKGPIIIGKNCWVGEDVVFLPGVTIGNNVIIGAVSIVTKDIPDNSVYTGNPAKQI